MSTTTDRRNFLSAFAGLGLVGITGAAAFAEQTQGVSPESAAAKEPPIDVLGRVPWPYRSLDAEVIGQRAFTTYSRGGCMLAVFDPVVRSVAERLGAPYTAFPFAMFSYGAGGVAGYGTLCGALNGAAAAFALLSPQPHVLINSLFAWYEKEALPDFKPEDSSIVPAIAVAIAGSVLCHASIARWCKASGKTNASPERAKRCAALSASVARKAVTLLNAQTAGQMPAPSPDSATVACLGCHGPKGSIGNASGRMPCAPCHAPAELATAGHPKT
jgi:hypothetical protein